MAVHAVTSSIPASAGYFPNTPMPGRPGCEITHCVLVWDGHAQRRRCYWRCPRASTPAYRYAPEAYTAAGADPSDPTALLLMALGVLVVMLIASAASSSASDVDEDVKETEALTRKLEDVAREADEHVAKLLKGVRSDEGSDDE